jgi:hypothetical protein
MQEMIRANKHLMQPADADKFVNVYAEGKLVKPEDSGYVLASLAVRAPKEMSGKFVSWDSPDCAEFRRK